MIRPCSLKYKDKAVIVSPAGNIADQIVSDAAKVLINWGLDVEVGKYALQEKGRFSGSIDERLHDLQSAINDPDIKLIFCSRGGYGTVHLLDKLNFDKLYAYPKWIIGFSDITALHSALLSKGIMSIHGPMAKHFADEGEDDVSARYTKAILAGQTVTYEVPVTNYKGLNRLGDSSGVLFGGNLSVFCSTLGTKLNKVPKNGILFIEDIGEEPYRVDRYMYQLKLAGILEHIQGLIVGQFTEYKEDEKMYSSLYDSIAFVVRDYNYPVCFDFPIGHDRFNFPMIIGNNSYLTVKENAVYLKQ